MPDAGDLVWIDFDPQAGHEQRGRRPALVLSPAMYNERSGLAILCPVTGHTKGYPFEVALPQDRDIQGVVLVDHLRSADWRARRASFAGRASTGVVENVRARLAALVGLH